MKTTIKLFSIGILASLIFYSSCISIKATAAKANELGWELSMQSYTFHRFTLAEALEKTQQLGIRNIEIFPGQKLGGNLGDGVFGYNLNKSQRDAIKKLAASKQIKIVASGVWVVPANEWEKVFAFARDMNQEFITAEPALDDWALVESLAKKYNIKVAVHNHPDEKSYWKPEILLNEINSRSSLLGASSDIGHYKRMDVEPLEAIKKIDTRLIAMHFKDIAQNMEDTIWGKGVLNIKAIMQQLKQQHFKGYFTVEYESHPEDNMAQIKESLQYFYTTLNEL